MYNVGDRVIFRTEVYVEDVMVARKGDVFTIKTIEHNEIQFEEAEFNITADYREEQFRPLPEALWDQVYERLKPEGRAPFIGSVMKNFTEDQLRAMVSQNIDLLDMDRWKLVDRMVKTFLTWEEAKKIIDVLYEMEIEILE